MRACFDEFVLDDDRREMTRAGALVHLSPKAFHLLAVLVRAAPTAVERDELHRQIWGSTHVEAANLPNLVHEIRVALGDGPKESRLIKTVHRYGYRFAAPVSVASPVCRFVIEHEGGESPLFEGENIIGRAAGSTVRVRSAGVSRRHAVIVVSGAVVTIEDLSSKNGTFVSGERSSGVVPLAIDTGIQVASVPLFFRERSGDSTITDGHPLPARRSVPRSKR